MFKLRATILLGALTAMPAHAAFHFMQIEQIIGGVQGNANAQAIQLRMRIAGQNQVQNSRLVAYDAAGLNPVVVINMGSAVANSTAGSRVLISSAQFNTAQMQPPVAADFAMTAVIPAGYLPAGRLTFENNAGTVIYWSVCWGGVSYTGSTTGATTNDADGTFGPCYAGALPSTTDQALQFTGAAGAMSTNNAADYALTGGQAVFTNNAAASQTVPVELQDYSVD